MACGEISAFIKEKKWKKLKKDQWLILFLAGVLLLVITLPTSCGDSSENSASDAAESASGGVDAASGGDTADEISAYEEQLESRLEETLAQMDGVGRVEVMISFSDTGESVVEKDVNYSTEEETDGEGEDAQTNTKTESSEETVYSSGTDEGTPFVSTQNLPAIEGILVVAEGGGKKAVAADISEAAEALFGLDAHKIKVVEMTQKQEGS